MYCVIGALTAAVTACGATYTPIVTMEDESGGTIHIAEDDRCTVFLLGREAGGYSLMTHIPPEVLAAAQAKGESSCTERVRW